MRIEDNIFFHFLLWYLWKMPKEIFKSWLNFLKFGLDFFSVPLLIKTWFAPWRRYSWDYGRGFDIKRYLETLFSNLITRTIGAVVRTILILIGLGAEIIILCLGPLALAAWFLLPFLSWWALESGLQIIFLSF